MFFKTMRLFVFFICLAGTINSSPSKVQSLRAMVEKIIPLRKSDGKIDIPSYVKHIKLDVGLAYSAPMSQYWLSHHEKDLFVFGFEPNPESVKSILQGAVKLSPVHGEPLEKKYIGKQFWVIPCALGSLQNSMVKFFVTAPAGCSSLYRPKQFSIKKVINVPVFSLGDFFDLFPFDTHPVIDYIKIDAQGADLDIVKSAGTYIKERVVFITLEAENNQYANTTNSVSDINNYMIKMGFQLYNSSCTYDPTYLNLKYKEYAQTHNIKIYQKG